MADASALVFACVDRVLALFIRDNVICQRIAAPALDLSARGGSISPLFVVAVSEWGNLLASLRTVGSVEIIDRTNEISIRRFVSFLSYFFLFSILPF